MNKTFLASVSLVGTIVGAGVFAIPYVMSKSGILLSLFYFVLIGLVAVLLHLFFGEIILRTKEEARLAGFAGKYLGKKAKPVVAFFVITGVAGSLLAYIILGGNFLSLIFPGHFSAFEFTVLFWLALSFLVFWGTRSIAWAEVLLTVVFFGAILLVFGFCLPKFQAGNLISAGWQNVFLPFGVFFFSLVGWSAIAEAEDILDKKKNLKKAVLSALAFCAVFYFVFGLVLSAVSGKQTSPDALTGLLPFLGQKVIILGGIFGLLAVGTSFLTLANYLKNTFVYDYRLPRFWSFALACCLPLVLFLAGMRNFLFVVSILGSLIGLVEGVSIVLIHRRAKKAGNREPEYSLKIPGFLYWVIIAVLVGGSLSQLIFRL
ncbi:MAG: amino acid permease [Patescibacteria group bacterium]|nr:amino acid permease [Patescibacteria group bacterium]